jgi:hypothetical protein
MAKLMQFGKLLKFPLYREFLQIYKNGQIIAILEIAKKKLPKCNKTTKFALTGRFVSANFSLQSIP